MGGLISIYIGLKYPMPLAGLALFPLRFGFHLRFLSMFQSISEKVSSVSTCLQAKKRVTPW